MAGAVRSGRHHQSLPLADPVPQGRKILLILGELSGTN